MLAKWVELTARKLGWHLFVAHVQLLVAILVSATVGLLIKSGVRALVVHVPGPADERNANVLTSSRFQRPLINVPIPGLRFLLLGRRFGLFVT